MKLINLKLNLLIMLVLNLNIKIFHSQQIHGAMAQHLIMDGGLKKTQRLIGWKN